MKSAQWMAVFILAMMVGGITFVMVYLGNNRSNSETPPTPASLTFVAKQFPQKGEKALTTEVNQRGYHDYWFRNESGQDVPIGLNEKGCTCSEVEVFLAPESWAPRLVDEAAGRFLRGTSALSPRPSDALRDLAAPYAPAQLPEEEAQSTLLTRDNSFSVPAGAFGWVRMSWRRKNPEAVPNLHAELWMSQRGGTASTRLDAGVLIARPVEVNKEMTLGPYTLRDLEKGQKTWILCWSLTRPTFHIQVEPVHSGKAESDPVEIGQPVALSDADLRHIEKSSEKLHMVRLLSGYRVPVTVRARAKDGTAIEWGHFRRFVNLTSDDDGIEPVEVKLIGEVHGDVTVGSGTEGGAINLGPFVRSRGTRGEIVLQTDAPGIDLELDKAHVPEFLEAKFPDKPETSPGGHRLWVLEVKVRPNAARGEFPRAEDPVYHDSAIYVKTKTEPRRTIRIPVTGVANP